MLHISRVKGWTETAVRTKKGMRFEGVIPAKIVYNHINVTTGSGKISRNWPFQAPLETDIGNWQNYR